MTFRPGSATTPLLLFVLAFAACERSPQVDVPAPGMGEATIRMCDIVPVSAVAEAVGADRADLSVEEGSESCRYSWPDGAAQVGPLVVAPSVEEADSLFAYTFGWRLTSDSVAVSPTGDEGAPLEPVEQVGDRAAYDGRVGYDEDPVLGRYAIPESSLWVLYRNVIVEVSVSTWQPRSAEAMRSGPDADERGLMREATLTLGQRVVTYLGRQSTA